MDGIIIIHTPFIHSFIHSCNGWLAGWLAGWLEKGCVL